MSAIENLTATTLRNIIGDLELDQSLTSRDHISGQMRAILDRADNWGIKVNRVELKNIMPPRDIQGVHGGKQIAGRARAPWVHPPGRGDRSSPRSWWLRARSSPPSCGLTRPSRPPSLQAEGAKQAKILEAGPRPRPS